MNVDLLQRALRFCEEPYQHNAEDLARDIRAAIAGCASEISSQANLVSTPSLAWSAIAAAENALNSIDQLIDLRGYPHAPETTLADLTREALRLLKKARTSATAHGVAGVLPASSTTRNTTEK